MKQITFKEFKLNLMAQPFFVWHTLPKNNEEHDLENFWKQDVDFANNTSAQVIMKTFAKIDEKLQEKLLEENALVLSGSIEDKIIETKKYYASDKLLINPVFEYNGAIAKPFAFDFKNKIIINLKYSKKTKRIDFIKAFYDYSIIKNSNVKINDYNLYLPKNEIGKKGIVNLTYVNHINITKGGAVYNDLNKKGELKSVLFMEEIKKPSGKFLIKDIDIYIEEINNARDVDKYTDNLFQDLTEFGNNPFFDELTEKINHPFSGFSGNIIPKSKIVNNEKVDNEVFKTYQAIETAEIMDMNEVKNVLDIIESSSRIIWYDFEGFSLPFPAIDNTKSYQQTVFQVSKIETNSNIEEVETKNLIWDPKNFDENDLYEIIKSVYSNKASIYIVYNKGYENVRLKEMALLLEGTEFEEEASIMYHHIEEHTIDLWDLFKITRGGKNVPPIMLNDQKCKSSIKNIEKHISKNKIDVGYKIKEYQDLDVKNGSMAMEAAIKRATGVIGNKEWEQKEAQLKEYCENDVRMMIMVYYFAKHLINQR